MVDGGVFNAGGRDPCSRFAEAIGIPGDCGAARAAGTPGEKGAPLPLSSSGAWLWRDGGSGETALGGFGCGRFMEPARERMRPAARGEMGAPPAFVGETYLEKRRPARGDWPGVCARFCWLWPRGIRPGRESPPLPP